MSAKCPITKTAHQGVWGPWQTHQGVTRPMQVRFKKCAACGQVLETESRNG